MTKLDPQFVEDRALRNAALEVLKADIEHAKESFKPKNVAGRMGERVKAGAEEVFELAKDRADDNRGAIAAVIGALFLFLARNPILEILGLKDAPDEDEDDSSLLDSVSESFAETVDDAGEALGLTTED